MEKKSVLSFLIVIVIFLSISLIFADSNTTTPDAAAYACLRSQLGSNCGNTVNSQQAAFNLLAMDGDSTIQSQCKSTLASLEQTNCWGVNSGSLCNIKSTSMGIFALKNIGQNVDNEVAWLLNRRVSGTGLTWYLEIDSNNQTTCTVNGVTFTILSNKQLAGSDPYGLSKSYNNYWFQITNTNQNFSISCQSPFVTTLLYQKTGDSTVFVSSDSHSAAGGDSTKEQVNSFCFSNSNVCDYEGTLWAAVALQKAGQDVSAYIPYISAMANDDVNAQYLPYAFLVMLNHNDDSYQTQLVNQQQESKYWSVGSDKLYDTALALLAMRDVNSDITSNTKAYLLSIRESSGCWLSDTAFLLYSGWMQTPIFSSGSGGAGTTSKCEDFGYNCTSRSECDLSNTLNNFFCSGTDVCCKVPLQKLKCSDKQGMICDSTQVCTGDTVTALDTNNCCLGSCVVPQNKTNDCTAFQYSCKTSCSSNEEEKTNYDTACDIGQKCCGAPSSTNSSMISWLWIILLAILIILLILAIMFREQLKIWFFRLKSGFKSKPGPTPSTRPSVPPTGFRPQPIQSPRGRQIIPRQPQPAMRPAVRSDKDKDFEETMKKLRDMSK